MLVSEQTYLRLALEDPAGKGGAALREAKGASRPQATTR